MIYINGFASCPTPSKIGIKTYRVPGTNVTVAVRSDIAPLLIGYAAEYNRLVEPLHPGWCWGYAYRNVRGSSHPSFHSAGIAIDLNAPKHPLGATGTVSQGQAAVIRALAHKYGLRWGGDYRTRKDQMHAEVILPHDAALALVARLQSPHASKPAPHVPVGPRTYPLLALGSTGTAVIRLQRLLHVTADGSFGPQTKAAVVAFQRLHHLVADGLAGAVTLKAMGF